MPATDFFSADEARKDLRKRTVRGGVVNGAAQAIGVGLQLATIPIVSRLLSPDDFGLVQIAAVFCGFGQLMIDVGFASASVQREDLTAKQASNLFWIATGMATVVAALLLLLSQPIAWVYGREEVAGICAVLAITYVTAGLTIQHQALLRRNLHFGSLAAIRVGGGVVAAAVAVGLGYAWRSYWALVWSQVAMSAFTMACSWIACSWRPGPPTRGVGTLSLVQFGANLTGARLVNYIARAMDRALIGAFVDATALGFYERAHKCLLFPVQRLNDTATSVMQPALSRSLENPSRYREACVTALVALGAVLTPAITYAAIDAPRLVPLVLGPGFEESTPIFRALIPTAYLATVNPLTGWLFVSMGRGGEMMRWQSLAAVVTVAGTACGLPWGAVGVAWGFSLSRVAVTPIGLLWCTRGSPVSLAGVAKALSPIVLSTAAAGAATLAAARMAPAWFGQPGLLSILSLALVMATVYTAAAAAQGLHTTLLKAVGRRKEATPEPGA